MKNQQESKSQDNPSEELEQLFDKPLTPQHGATLEGKEGAITQLIKKLIETSFGGIFYIFLLIKG